MTGIASQAVAKRLDFYGIGAQDSDYRAIGKSLAKYADDALAGFYKTVEGTPDAARFFPNREGMDKARRAQKDHWVRLFADGVTDRYVESANRIGRVHSTIGLAPEWYIGGYARIMEHIVSKMMAHGAGALSPARRSAARRAGKFIKLALLDMDIALATYTAAEEERRTAAIEKIGNALSAMSSGDLTVRLSGLPQEYDQLQNDFNSAISGLGATLSGVTDGARSISTGAAEIRSASTDLSQRTEQQAASLEESAAAMNELTSMISDTTQAMGNLNASIAQTHRQAIDGGEVVRNAMAAMTEIEKSSGAIGNIITLIDGIAFQTNLLALNAGVEAARVGEHGKGFAVVANEVRSLAQRSSEAAEEIRKLIQSSLGEVENGVRLVGEVGQALNAILNQVGESSAVAEQISGSSVAQSENLKHINGAVADMNRTTQQNAAMVEESTAAARTMAEEAQRLSTAIGRFQVDAGPGHGQGSFARAA
ncbi:methyl-accepting chemotaxis protein [Sphingobium sufflavum]|uniref:globin-coupled sensor protein n=1 Tax=Sphingobium sufflavum TaxID=1129547 RepID=UPI001F261EAA|nr:globin-coupled sensor protein [Sphingobium sufflavum]MCE7797456.1 methyl-accepting chemotaxis protein [Sphingobium sufflavum]